MASAIFSVSFVTTSLWLFAEYFCMIVSFSICIQRKTTKNNKLLPTIGGVFTEFATSAHSINNYSQYRMFSIYCIPILNVLFNHHKKVTNRACSTLTEVYLIKKRLKPKRLVSTVSSMILTQRNTLNIRIYVTATPRSTMMFEHARLHLSSDYWKLQRFTSRRSFIRILLH